MLALQLQDKIIVQGEPVVYQHPSEPFTYLWVDMTLGLNWRHHLFDRMANNAAALQRTSAAAKYKIRILLQTVVKPMITYAFQVAPYRAIHLRRLGSKIAQMAKQAYRQCPGTPTTI